MSLTQVKQNLTSALQTIEQLERLYPANSKLNCKQIAEIMLFSQNIKQSDWIPIFAQKYDLTQAVIKQTIAELKEKCDAQFEVFKNEDPVIFVMNTEIPAGTHQTGDVIQDVVDKLQQFLQAEEKRQHAKEKRAENKEIKETKDKEPKVAKETKKAEEPKQVASQQVDLTKDSLQKEKDKKKHDEKKAEKAEKKAEKEKKKAVQQ